MNNDLNINSNYPIVGTNMPVHTNNRNTDSPSSLSEISNASTPSSGNRTSLYSSLRQVGGSVNANEVFSDAFQDISEEVGSNPESQTAESVLNQWVNFESNPSRRDCRADVRDRILRAGVSLQGDKIQVGGNLDLSQNTNLEMLPDNLQVVNGYLNLTGCTKLTKLPDNLQVVNGYLNLTDCRCLKKLPDNLQDINGFLALPRSEAFQKLPDNLRVDGNLDLNDRLVWLNKLPDNLQVGGNLDLSGCNLTESSDNLQVGGNLELGNWCYDLTKVANTLQVGGNLTVNTVIGFPNFTELSDNLRVDGNLDLSGWKSLKKLPDNLQVGGNMNLTRCIKLTKLPKNLQFGGYDLNLTGCTRLKRLPNNLHVSRNLNLERCLNLNKLPDNLRVDGNLNLSGCIRFQQLPNDLQLGGNLDLSGCTSLTSLPAWITQLGRCENGNIREIDITHTNFSENVQEQLRQAHPEGIRFIFDHAPAAIANNLSLPHALNHWGIDQSQLISTQITGLVSENQISEHQTQNLSTYLVRLKNTADARNNNTRPLMQQRVNTLMQGIVEDYDGFREIALNTISVGLESCDDRVIHALNDIEVALATRQAERAENPKESLTNLARSLFARECIHEEAARLANRPGYVDPLEVYLTLEIELRETFNLPGQAQTMLFRRCANLSEQDIAGVKTTTQSRLSDAEKLNQFISTFDPLIKLNRREAAEHFDITSLASITESEAGLTSDTSCMISGNRYDELVNVNSGSDIVIVRGSGNQYFLFCKESLLEDWVNRGKSILTGRDISLDEYRTEMFRVRDDDNMSVEDEAQANLNREALEWPGFEESFWMDLG